jgi:RHS repeat-associated protein
MRSHSGANTSDYKYTDQELDNDARMYDPVIGRFISADSIFPEPYNPQSLNRYSYCINNPLIYHDPNGHDYILLNDTTGAIGFGHNAVLVGSNKNEKGEGGWTYYSKDGNFFGTQKGNKVYRYDTYEEFIADIEVSGRYSRQLRVATSED